MSSLKRDDHDFISYREILNLLLKNSITIIDGPPKDSNSVNSNDSNKSSAVSTTDNDRDCNNNSVIKETNRIETNKSEISNGDSNSHTSERSDGNTNKKAQSKNVSIKSETKKKIYIIGDSMVKHIKGWDLSAKLDHRHNIYVQNFHGAKVRSMKDYTKPCTREESPDHIILHVWTNNLISDNSPREVTVCGIIPRNDEWNNKAELVHNHLKEMWKSSNIDFIDNGKNFNSKKHLNNRKLHLNDKGPYKPSNILVNYISSICKWYDINKPFANINSNDITSNISDVCTESVSKTAPPIRNINLESEYFENKLKSLRTSNLRRIIIAQININSIRNKFKWGKRQC